ncbi:ash family protein, partial [Salmonella enterica]|nr:ash family protein [Salmonella enterica]
MTTYKNRLPVPSMVGYSRPASHKTGAGFRSLLTTTAHSRASGFFTCKASSRLFIRIMAGRTGEPKGSPGSVVAGTANPVRFATPSFAASGGELTVFTTTGAPSWPTAKHAATPRIVSISRPKSTAACTAQKNWRSASISNPSAITAFWLSCAFHPFSVTWRMICRTFTTWLTAKSTPCNPP